MSVGGAVDPAWSKNGNELFYRTGAQQMMAVPFTVSGGSFQPRKPVMLFQLGSLGGGTTVRAAYDVTRDGRFLLNQPMAEAAAARNQKINPPSVRIVLNWMEEVRRLLAPR